MIDGLEGLVKVFDQTADILSGEAMKRCLRASGMAAKKAALNVAEQVVGGDRAIVMGGRRKVTLGAGYDIAGDSSVSVALKPPGPWVLFDKGAKDHHIPRARRRASSKVLRFPMSDEQGSGYARYSNVRGIRGKRAVARAFAKAQDEGTSEFGKAVLKEVARVWQ